MTTIKEAIERGLYPKDERGRALVPVRNGFTATVLMIDAPGPFCIVAVTNDRVCRWNEEGRWYYRDCDYQLLPPRNLVKAWGARLQSGALSCLIYPTREEAEAHAKRGTVELTGIYEEPRS